MSNWRAGEEEQYGHTPERITEGLRRIPFVISAQAMHNVKIIRNVALIILINWSLKFLITKLIENDIGTGKGGAVADQISPGADGGSLIQFTNAVHPSRDNLPRTVSLRISIYIRWFITGGSCAEGNGKPIPDFYRLSRYTLIKHENEEHSPSRNP